MKIRSAYEKKERVQIAFAEQGRTKQSMRDETDINWIMKKYLKTGHLSHAQAYGGEYAFATSEDFHQSMNIVTQATEMFEALPSTTRSRFANDPGRFLDFVQNTENLQELIDLGLANPPPEKEIVPTPPVPNPGPPPA